MMDAAEELKKALANYMKIRNRPDWPEHGATHRLVGLVEENLPSLLAELEELRPMQFNPEQRETSRHDQMTLGQLVDELAKLREIMPVVFDDGSHPRTLNSYRGYYAQLALSPGRGVDPWSTANWHEFLSDAEGAVFEGYKGGNYRMTRDTPLWCAGWGDATGVMIVGTKVTGDGFVIETWKEEEDQP